MLMGGRWVSEFTERHIKGRPGCLNGKRIRLPMQETKEMKVRSLGRENPQEKEMVTHSSILA